MAYQIDRFNGTFFVSVDDQTINSTATDLRLVGKNYSGYGEIQNENLLHLLENFANSSAPPRAINGQLWFDTSTKKVKVYDGTKFKVISGAESSATAPTGLAAGDFWYDNQNEQIHVWTGTEFTLVGPEKSPTYGDTAVVPVAVKDSVGTDQQIIKLMVGGEVLAIVSSATFSLHPVINPITGFSSLRPGINFINSGSSTGETTSSHRFWGTVSNSDRLGGYTASDFLRVGNPSFDAQVNFKDTGLTVGDQYDFKISIAGRNSPILESTLDRPFVLRISNNGADVKDIMVVKPTGVEPGSTGLYDLGTTGAKWKTVNADEVKATTFYGKLVGTVETAPGPGGVVPPLAIQSVAVSGSFNMSASGGGASSNFSVNLAGSTSAVNLSSGTVGTLDNFNIGGTNPGTAVFTTVSANGTVRLTGTAASTTTTSGTLIVSGGVGIAGSLNVGGDSKFTSTGGIGIPVGSTAQRPTSPSVGMIRYNTTVGEWEGWDGSEWRGLRSVADEDYGLITSSADVFVDYGGLS